MKWFRASLSYSATQNCEAVSGISHELSRYQHSEKNKEPQEESDQDQPDLVGVALDLAQVGARRWNGFYQGSTASAGGFGGRHNG